MSHSIGPTRFAVLKARLSSTTPVYTPARQAPQPSPRGDLFSHSPLATLTPIPEPPSPPAIRFQQNITPRPLQPLPAPSTVVETPHCLPEVLNNFGTIAQQFAEISAALRDPRNHGTGLDYLEREILAPLLDHGTYHVQFGLRPRPGTYGQMQIEGETRLHGNITIQDGQIMPSDFINFYPHVVKINALGPFDVNVNGIRTIRNERGHTQFIANATSFGLDQPPDQSTLDVTRDLFDHPVREIDFPISHFIRLAIEHGPSAPPPLQFDFTHGWFFHVTANDRPDPQTITPNSVGQLRGQWNEIPLGPNLRLRDVRLGLDVYQDTATGGFRIRVPQAILSTNHNLPEPCQGARVESNVSELAVRDFEMVVAPVDRHDLSRGYYIPTLSAQVTLNQSHLAQGDVTVAPVQGPHSLRLSGSGIPDGRFSLNLTLPTIHASTQPITVRSPTTTVTAQVNAAHLEPAALYFTTDGLPTLLGSRIPEIFVGARLGTLGPHPVAAVVDRATLTNATGQIAVSDLGVSLGLPRIEANFTLGRFESAAGSFTPAIHLGANVSQLHGLNLASGRAQLSCPTDVTVDPCLNITFSPHQCGGLLSADTTAQASASGDVRLSFENGSGRVVLNPLVPHVLRTLNVRVPTFGLTAAANAIGTQTGGDLTVRPDREGFTVNSDNGQTFSAALYTLATGHARAAGQRAEWDSTFSVNTGFSLIDGMFRLLVGENRVALGGEIRGTSGLIHGGQLRGPIVVDDHSGSPVLTTRLTVESPDIPRTAMNLSAPVQLTDTRRNPIASYGAYKIPSTDGIGIAGMTLGLVQSNNGGTLNVTARQAEVHGLRTGTLTTSYQAALGTQRFRLPIRMRNANGELTLRNTTLRVRGDQDRVTADLRVEVPVDMHVVIGASSHHITGNVSLPVRGTLTYRGIRYRVSSQRPTAHLTDTILADGRRYSVPVHLSGRTRIQVAGQGPRFSTQFSLPLGIGGEALSRLGFPNDTLGEISLAPDSNGNIELPQLEGNFPIVDIRGIAIILRRYQEALRTQNQEGGTHGTSR